METRVSIERLLDRTDGDRHLRGAPRPPRRPPLPVHADLHPPGPDPTAPRVHARHRSRRARRCTTCRRTAFRPASPRSTTSRTNADTASSAWPPPSGCSGSSDSTRGWPATSRPGIPSCLDHFWVNPLGMNFKLIRVKDLILVNDRGEVVDGNWPVNAAAFAIHSQIHAARPDVVAAAHAHSVHGKAWSSLRRPLDPLTQDSCAFYGDHAVFDDYTGVGARSRGGQAHRPRARRRTRR